MASHRWILAGLTTAGTLAAVAAALLALAPHPAWLNFTPAPGPAANALTLRADGPNVELLDTATGAVLQSRLLAATRGVSIHGLPGQVDDTLTVDLSGGPLALPDGIIFDGGAGGYDTLAVTGGDPAPGSYQPTGPQSGIMTHGATRITFANLEPATDFSTVTNYLITPTADVITLTVADGGSCGSGCQSTLLTSPSFESLAFANKTNVTIGGVNFKTIIVNNPHPATGLSKLVLDSGGLPTDSIQLKSFNLPGGTLLLTDVVTVTQSGAFTVTNLAVQASGPVDLSGPNNGVTTLAARVTQPGAYLQVFARAPTLTVGVVEGIAGVTTANGRLSIDNCCGPSGDSLVVSQPIASGGSEIDLLADRMTLSAAVNAGAGLVLLDNDDSTIQINLGAKPPSKLGLLQSDLNQITAGVLQIGSTSDTGGLFVSAPIVAPAGWSTLDLEQTAAIGEQANVGLTVTNLSLYAAGIAQVDLSGLNNQVTNLAGLSNGNFFHYVNSGPLTIGSVNGFDGVTAGSGSVILQANTGGLTVTKNVQSTGGLLYLWAVGSGSPADNVTVSPGVTLSATGNSVQIVAGDWITLGAGSRAQADGVVDLEFATGDTDGLGGGNLAGRVAVGGTATVEAGAPGLTLTVDYAAGAALPNGLAYTGNGGDAVVFSDAGDNANGHSYGVDGSNFDRELSTPITFSQVPTVTVIGGNLDDYFNVTPAAGVTFHVAGGPPGTYAADKLFLDLPSVTSPTLALTGSDATGLAGQWTFGNRLPVYFRGIDILVNLDRILHLPLVMRGP